MTKLIKSFCLGFLEGKYNLQEMIIIKIITVNIAELFEFPTIPTTLET